LTTRKSVGEDRPVLSRGRIWLALDRHWVVLALVAFVFVWAIASPDDLGVGWWIAIGLGGLALFLLGVYGLTRFVAWAARQR
jgi:hypothetical protein